jgi:hypothetical protein
MAFSIELTSPKHGWLDIALGLGGEQLRLRASDVAGDPVRSLAELTLFIKTGQPGTLGAVFWREPAGYELRATRVGDELVMAVNFSRDAYVELHDPHMVVEAPADPAEVVAELVRALLAAQRVLPVNGKRGVWRWPFPAAQLARLTAPAS